MLIFTAEFVVDEGEYGTIFYGIPAEMYDPAVHKGAVAIFELRMDVMEHLRATTGIAKEMRARALAAEEVLHALLPQGYSVAEVVEMWRQGGEYEKRLAEKLQAWVDSVCEENSKRSGDYN